MIAGMQQMFWTAVASSLAMAFTAWVMLRLSRRGKYPRLAEPDPGSAPRTLDRLRYYGANLLALAIGGVAGVLLWSIPPIHEDGVLWRQSLYDHPAGRLIGPFFLMVSVAAMLAYQLAASFVAAEPLQHILWKSAILFHRLDPRPVTKWAGRVVGTLAILLHTGMRMEHTTMDAAGVRWCEWPWQQEVTYTWNEVTDVRIVRTFAALTGTIVVRPWLRIEFVGGEVWRLGRHASRPATFWEEAADIVAAHAEVQVQHVERE